MSTLSKITTTHVYPPIPMRQFDWMACRGDYEPGCLVGYGRTEGEAIHDLLTQDYDDEELPTDQLIDPEQAGQVLDAQLDKA